MGKKITSPTEHKPALWIPNGFIIMTGTSDVIKFIDVPLVITFISKSRIADIISFTIDRPNSGVISFWILFLRRSLTTSSSAILPNWCFKMPFIILTAIPRLWDNIALVLPIWYITNSLILSISSIVKLAVIALFNAVLHLISILAKAFSIFPSWS